MTCDEAKRPGKTGRDCRENSAAMGRFGVMKARLILAAVAAALPMGVGAAEWHMVPDDVNPGVPIKTANVIGAVAVNSIKKNGDFAEAQIAVFYTYDLTEAVFSKATSDKNSDLGGKLKAAIDSGRPSAYAGMEQAFKYRGERLLSASDTGIRNLLVGSEILIDEGYARISTRTIQVQCESRLDFRYRYDASANWTLYGLPRDGSGTRGEMLPFICDKAGMGQSEPAPPPPPIPEMVRLQQIFRMEVLPKWKFLGVDTDLYGRRYFVFFAADTIEKKETYTDVVVASAQHQFGSVSGPSPDGFISGVQEGRYRPGSVYITHVHCDTERIDPGPKLFETQLVSYVCAHQQNQPSSGTKRH